LRWSRSSWSKHNNWIHRLTVRIPNKGISKFMNMWGFTRVGLAANFPRGPKYEVTSPKKSHPNYHSQKLTRNPN
jgi:hypothetical protein